MCVESIQQAGAEASSGTLWLLHAQQRQRPALSSSFFATIRASAAPTTEQCPDTMARSESPSPVCESLPHCVCEAAASVTLRLRSGQASRAAPGAAPAAAVPVKKSAAFPGPPVSSPASESRCINLKRATARSAAARAAAPPLAPVLLSHISARQLQDSAPSSEVGAENAGKDASSKGPASLSKPPPDSNGEPGRGAEASATTAEGGLGVVRIWHRLLRGDVRLRTEGWRRRGGARPWGRACELRRGGACLARTQRQGG